MRLNKILKVIGILTKYPNDKITGFTRKENEIEDGFIFFSFEPLTIKKYQVLKAKGVSYIIGEEEFYHSDYIRVLSIKKAYQDILYYVNKWKLKNKVLIGVTGTNGKTSVSTLVYSFLSKKGTAIYYGSNGIYSKSYYESHNTTPSMEEFFKHLGNEKYIVIEISSISFYEYRLFHIPFKYIILTNIYEDHLDYHQTVLDYYYTKMLIIANNPNTTLLMSDEIKDKRMYRLSKFSYIYGINDNELKISIDNQSHENIIEVNDGLSLIRIYSKLEGKYNAYNILAAIKLLYIMGFSLEEIGSHYNKPIGISGRQNKFTYKGKTIIVDYPHTKSAYEVLFSNLRSLYKGKWLAVFGAGGNRQKSKRKEYGEVVSKYCDYAIITDDNPRDEDELAIAKDIVEGLSIKYEIILDRKDAISKALKLIDDYDLVLILGKGQEDYIEVKGNRIEHNDLTYIKELIEC